MVKVSFSRKCQKNHMEFMKKYTCCGSISMENERIAACYHDFSMRTSPVLYNKIGFECLLLIYILWLLDSPVHAHFFACFGPFLTTKIPYIFQISNLNFFLIMQRNFIRTNPILIGDLGLSLRTSCFLNRPWKIFFK